MPRHIHVCQVCGYEEEMQLGMELEVYYHWFLHRVQFVGGFIDVLACAECNKLTIDEIFEGYKHRIRSGEVQSYH